MKAKVTLVSGDLKKIFTFEHAESILKHPSNLDKKGAPRWTLPKDSKFEFKNNELRTKSDK